MGLGALVVLLSAAHDGAPAFRRACGCRRSCKVCVYRRDQTSSRASLARAHAKKGRKARKHPPPHPTPTPPFSRSSRAKHRAGQSAKGAWADFARADRGSRRGSFVPFPVRFAVLGRFPPVFRSGPDLERMLQQSMCLPPLFPFPSWWCGSFSARVRLSCWFGLGLPLHLLERSREPVESLVEPFASGRDGSLHMPPTILDAR